MNKLTKHISSIFPSFSKTILALTLFTSVLMTPAIISAIAEYTMDIDLSTSDASFWGEDDGDQAGYSVASAGDVNNDGYDDILIGAYIDEDGGASAGQTYLILGKSSGWAMDTDLSAADASFWGEDAGDNSGFSVASAGDVNNDNYDDFLIGAYYDDDGGDGAGQVYLILGKSSGWAMDTDLSTADASFWGEDAGNRAGFSVASAGDVNNDNYDDILIGAYADGDGGSQAGQTYLILGKSSGWAMDTDLSTADASFWGEDTLDYAGKSVASAGDVNNDNYDDILIGAWGDDDGGDYAGQTYLILGKSSGWAMDTDLSASSASFIGEDDNDYAGKVVASAGDVNGDGYDDFIIGAEADEDGGGSAAGQTYLILGKSSGWTMDTDLSTADASFWGEEASDYAGISVSSAGDVNNDGYSDILIGAYRNVEGASVAGQAYLILGKSSGWAMDTDLSAVDASFWGEDANDYSGWSVSGAGDVNNDGYSDILIGAYGDDDGGASAGQTYLILSPVLGPSAPTIGVPTILSTTSIRWNFTDNASDETGFKVYDDGTPTLKVTCATANLSYCDEASLSANTQYTRKVLAYNGIGDSPYSSTATKYTLATVPSVPVVNNPQLTTLDVNPDPNGSPTSTEMAIYKETGAACDGAGGSYIAANGSDNGATAVWQAESAWSAVTATGLTSGIQYSFCTKSRNGDNVETAFGSAASAGTAEAIAPVITVAESTTATDTGVTITWTTDEDSSSQIEYGVNTTYGTTTSETDTSPRVTSHSVVLSSLQSCTTHHYRVISKDTFANTLTGTDMTFTTSGCTGSSTIEAEVAGTVDKDVGADVELLDGGDSKIKLTVPVAFSATNAEFQIKQLDKSAVILATSTPTADIEAVNGHAYQLDALSDVSTKITSFDQPISITMTYTDAEIAAFVESTLLIYRWDGSDWYVLDSCAVDTVSKTVACETSAFSTFVLFGEGVPVAASSSSSSSSSGGGGGSSRQCDNFPPGTNSDLFQANTTDTSTKIFFTPLLDSKSFHIAYSTKKDVEEYAVKVSLAKEGVQNFTIGYLEPNTTYYFKVRGMDDCGFGDWSNAIKVKTNSKGQTTEKLFYKNTFWNKVYSYITKPKVKETAELVKPDVKGKTITKPTPVPSPIQTSKPIESKDPNEGKFCFWKWCF